MRKKEPVIENSRDSKILFLIANEINYNQGLSKKEHLNIKPNALIVHIKKLEKDKFVISERFQKNYRKVYSIEYKKILEEYLDWLEKGNSSPYLKNPIALKDFIKKNKSELKKNKLLLNWLKVWFENYSKMIYISMIQYQNSFRVADCFKESLDFFNHIKKSPDNLKLNGYESEWKLFSDFLKNIDLVNSYDNIKIS